MNFIAEMGFDVKEGRTKDLQAWLQDNEAELAKECPPGIEYLGTYTAIYNPDTTLGSCRIYWRMDSYAAQDRFAAAMKDGGRFAELIEEQTAFVDQRNEANWSSGLYKAIADASIWGEE